MQDGLEKLKILLGDNARFLGVVAIWGAARICETLKIGHFCFVRSQEARKVIELPEDLRHKEETPYKASKVGIKKEASKCLNEFIAVMKSHPHTDMNRFYKNCNSFSIESFSKKKKGIYVTKAYFDLFNSKIFLSTNPRGSIFHEFMHRLTLRLGDGYIFSGLSQKKFFGPEGKEQITFSIGNALNEAYTQYITERYFKEHGCNIDSYAMTKHFAYYIEHLVGRESMEKAYFESDLYTVVQELAQYSSIQEVIRMLELMDEYAEAIYESTSIPRKLAVKRTYRELMLIILKMELRKLESDIQSIEDEKMRTRYFECEVDFLTIMFVPRKDERIRYQLKKSDARAAYDVIKKYKNGSSVA